MRYLTPITLLTCAFGCCWAQGFGPLEVEVAQQEPVSWIFAHMKLVVIIGGAISAAGVVMIIGLSVLDCLVNSSTVVPLDEDNTSQVHNTHQTGSSKRSSAAFDNTGVAAHLHPKGR